MIGHVEGGEAPIGMAEHGLNGVISVDATPSAACLPHPIENAANDERIITVAHCRHSCTLLRRAHAHDGLPSVVAPPLIRSQAGAPARKTGVDGIQRHFSTLLLCFCSQSSRERRRKSQDKVFRAPAPVDHEMPRCLVFILLFLILNNNNIIVINLVV